PTRHVVRIGRRDYSPFALDAGVGAAERALAGSSGAVSFEHPSGTMLVSSPATSQCQMTPVLPPVATVGVSNNTGSGLLPVSRVVTVICPPLRIVMLAT